MIENNTNLCIVIHYCIIYKIRHSTRPSNKIFLKDYGFLFKLEKKIGKNISINLSGKYRQTLFNKVQKSAAYRRKIAPKTVKGTSDSIGNNVEDKVTGATSQSAPGTASSQTEDTKSNVLAGKSIETPLKRSVSLKKTNNY